METPLSFAICTVAAETLDGKARLAQLHGIFHMDEQVPFRFEWEWLAPSGLSIKDFVAPSGFEFRTGKQFRMGKKYGAVSFVQILAPELNDRMLADFLDMESSLIVSLHIQSVDQVKAIKTVKRKITDLDRSKIEEQKKAVRAGYDMDIIPSDLATYGNEAKKLLQDLQSRNERMFLVTFLVLNTADNPRQLDNNIFQASSIAHKEPRLRFTDEERADPALEKPIRKADKAAAKADKAQAKIPKKKVRQKMVDPETGKVTTKLVLEDKKKPPSKLSHAVRDAPANVLQSKYVIISTQKPRVNDARDRLRQVQGHLVNILSDLGSTVRSVDNTERLRILHNFFRVGEEARFEFDLDRCTKLGEDFRDFVAPDTIEFKRDHIVIDNRVAKCMSMSYFPQRIDDKLVTTLLQQVPYIILTLDFVPIETEDAYKTLADYRMKVDADKVRFNRKSVDNLDFTANVPQRTQEEENTLNQWQQDMSDNDQQMFLALLTVAYFADDLEELNQETDALKTAAGNFNCRFTEMRWQQENTFNTAMPYGLRRIANLRAMTTKGVASLIPFNTQEVLVPGGIYYGVNAISGNLIITLRTVLINGNAMVIATSGGGKSLFVKQEILELFLRFPNAKFYIVDPENEYSPLVCELGGLVVDIAVDSTTYFNPLDFTYDPVTKILPHVAKAEFVLSLCEQVMAKDGLEAGG